jgi:hypothetical protein
MERAIGESFQFSETTMNGIPDLSYEQMSDEEIARMRNVGEPYSPVRSRDEIIAANDLLRTQFKGGRIEICDGPFEFDDRLIGRMLCVLARFSNFGDDNLHDSGLFIFSGYSFEFFIEDVDGERVLRVWVERDVLWESERV